MNQTQIIIISLLCSMIFCVGFVSAVEQLEGRVIWGSPEYAALAAEYDGECYGKVVMGGHPALGARSVGNLPSVIYTTGPEERIFNYILRGKPGEIPVTLYSGVYKAQQDICDVLWSYDDKPKIYTYDKFLTEPIQTKELKKIADSIREKTPNQDDQARIAVSMVQHIPYDHSIDWSYDRYTMRYPYQVLYENKGICGETSILLAYLLKELGYGVVLFSFDQENHMTVGVRSPPAFSYKDTGYAFIETTSPTIMTRADGEYEGLDGDQKLTSSPEIIPISEGRKLTSISEEYRDSQSLAKLEAMGPVLERHQFQQWEKLIKKYGIPVKSQ